MAAPLSQTLGIDVPVIQAPIGSASCPALAAAVSNAGGLGSLPCAMLGPDAMREELAAIRRQTARPFNVNFFCHEPPAPSPEREARWHAALAPYYTEFGIDPDTIPVGPGPAPFRVRAGGIAAGNIPGRGLDLRQDGGRPRVVQVDPTHP